jgi:hypothetical protein
MEMDSSHTPHCTVSYYQICDEISSTGFYLFSKLLELKVMVINIKEYVLIFNVPAPGDVE